MSTTPSRITAISEKGLEIIRRYESFEGTAYKCPAGVWTIGYGTTRYPDGRPVRSGDRISMEDAKKLLAYDCRRFAQAVDACTRDDVQQHEFDALVSFCYNLGESALRGSTLLRLVNAREQSSIRIHDAFLMWNKVRIVVDGQRVAKALDGLTSRRMSEALLYNEGRVVIYYKGKPIK